MHTVTCIGVSASHTNKVYLTVIKKNIFFFGLFKTVRYKALIIWLMLSAFFEKTNLISLREINTFGWKCRWKSC
jgi:hypothetical protein